ncbi:MAG: carboxylating nicotinate-nucleotide diphosphorylase [bacterium]
MQTGGNIKKKSALSAKEKKQFLKIIRNALKEDIGRGDITTDPIVDMQQQALGIIFPKQDGILCGIDIAKMVFEVLDDQLDFQGKMTDGMLFSPGMTIATLVGPAVSCLKGERTALNFLQHLSGIATLTSKFVEATEGNLKILDTRKTLPGLRLMEKYAVRTGGGNNHRFGLYDMILIKDNHIEIAGSITAAVEAARKNNRRAFVEVEVKTFMELDEALAAKINRIMLDNMNHDQLRKAIEIIRTKEAHTEIEISGGIDLYNIAAYKDSGVDFISVGALTHSAPAIDIAMKLKPLGQGES